jgi:hypothetical protein
MYLKKMGWEVVEWIDLAYAEGCSEHGADGSNRVRCREFP